MVSTLTNKLIESLRPMKERVFLQEINELKSPYSSGRHCEWMGCRKA